MYPPRHCRQHKTIFYFSTSLESLPEFSWRRHTQSFYLAISTPWLKPLLVLHLEPINLVVFEVPKKPNLGVGFPLICLQRLSRTSVATQQCSWRNNWYTIGSHLPVLSSSYSFISKCSDYIFIHQLVESAYYEILNPISLFRAQSIRGQT